MATPTPNLPNPQSFEQILTDLLSAYASKLGINDFNVAAVNTSFFEVVALATARASGSVFQILKDFSIDRATGDALKRLAQEDGVNPIVARPATGNVNFIDTSFVKISTKVYAGTNPPNIGSVTINVGDASLFPGTGSIYIGRGTPNVEGPLPYSSITPIGGFFAINLTTPTTKFHNIGESVILAQGGVRTIPANTVVVSPGIGSSADIQYGVVTGAIILDGETEVDGVAVAALTPGSSGNVPIGSVSKLQSPPFSGATVTNPAPFTTGQDNETDDQLRTRIKNTLASTGLGTAIAVENSVIGATPSDEQATVVSDNIATDNQGNATLYIDDGNLYEAKSAGVGLESIIDSALGGEQFFQLSTGGRQAPVAKAFLQSTLSAPFDLIQGDTLALIVGDVTYQHVFTNSDFLSPGGATAFEVTASINADTNLGFEATTASNGMFVVVRAKAEANDSIQITTPNTSGRDASLLLGFSASRIDTLRLYKNDIPLSKDGMTATVFTQNQELWSSSIQNGDALVLAVDGTAPITFTFLDADFIVTGLFTTVAASNSLASWVQVFNAKLTGVTASLVGQQIELTSNLGTSSRAQVTIIGSSTLVSKGMFNAAGALSSTGANSDYTLNRNTAQIQLAIPLVKGDKLSAGSIDTEATILSGQVAGGNITFPEDAHLWLLIDNPGQIVPTGIAANTLISVSKPTPNIIRYGTTVANAFSTVFVGDYVIVWCAELDPTDRIEGRVAAVTGTTIDIEVTAAEFASIVTTSGTPYVAGFVVLRSSLAPQKFKLAAGSYSLDQIAQALQLQTPSLLFSVFQEQFLVIESNTKNADGRVLVVTSDTAGTLLNLTAGTSSVSQVSLIAFYDSQETEADMPLFIHSTFATEETADPIDSYITSFDSTISLAGRDPNELIAILHPYGQIRDAQPYGEHVQESAITGSTITIGQEKDMRRFRAEDRFFVANPLDFGSADTLVVILDQDPTEKSFAIPFFRRALTNTDVPSNPNNFNAYDVDSGATTNFQSFFPNFDFSNFKVLMQAKKTLKPTPPKTALLYRATAWGRSGQAIHVGYTYPTSANQTVGSVILVNSEIDVMISLKSGAPIPTAIDSTTEWNVSITPNTPSAGIDQVTYTYASGTAPNLTLSGGEYVNIGPATEFNRANIGAFKISTQSGFLPSSTAFTVQRPTGVAVAETNRATQAINAIVFYQAADTTAADVNTYVNANLSNILTSTIVNDGGTDGSGIIPLSTDEDGGFTASSVQLQDGINWLLSSNLSGSPQFTFKVPLTLPTDVGYAFNNGEDLRFVPTTFDQVARLISILAVTGFTTVGQVTLVDRGNKLELSTLTLGSEGSLQIIGGTANQYQVPVLGTAAVVDNSLAAVSTSSIAASGMASDQWFRLQASIAQKKTTLLASNTSVTVQNSDPSFGQSLVTLSNRLLTQRYFGKPRHNVRPVGATFRIEKQGSLVCLSWDTQGASPVFVKSPLNFNDSSGGTVNVAKLLNSNDSQYIIVSGNANFTELSIGDLLTVSGLSAENNGTFLVTGVSDDGLIAQVQNSSATDQFSSASFTFGTNSTAGDIFSIGATNLVAGTDFPIGVAQTDTAANLASIIGTLVNVSAVANGSIVTVTATIPSANISLGYTGAGTVTVSAASLQGATFVAGNFTATSGVSEGDSVIINSAFNILNQGTFRVIRQFNNSVWFENPNVVEEEVTLPANAVALDIDTTTSLMVNATSNSLRLSWNGPGTEPFLGEAQIGDLMTFGSDFSTGNQGIFMVLDSGEKLQQISQLTMPTGAQLPVSGAGAYFFINSAGNINQYYVWFNVNSANSDPAPGGKTAIAVAVLSGDNSTQVATKVMTAINLTAVGLTATSLANIVTTTTSDFIETNDPVNVNVPAPFNVNVIQEGQRTFLECIDPTAVNESVVVPTTPPICNRPSMRFFEYEASVPGDQFVITGSVLTAQNAGSYPIVRVVDRDHAIVTGNLANVTAGLFGFETAVFVQEATPYYGYKQVAFITADPASPTRSIVTFNTDAQSEKIDDSAGVQIVSLNKTNFSTTLKIGLDSYRYNTGLIAEANRIVYGDPREPETYPGSGAAGANIFIKEPLARRVQVAIDVRLQTGVPFTAISQQIRTTIVYLVKSNPIGQSIAISDIVSAVQAIPGIRAVAISSPLYDVNDDLIFIAPSEKSVIISPTVDISVSQIGS